MKPLLSVLLLALALSQSATAMQDQASFEAGLIKVEKTMNQGKWKKAGGLLTELLAAHERADYVYVEKMRVMEDIQLIVLYQAEEEPTADSVLAGKVKKYDAAKGKIDVTFEGADLPDFIFGGNKGYNFPPTFTGPYSIEVSGDDYPFARNLQVSIDWTTPNHWYIGLGSKRSKPYMSLAASEGVEEEMLEQVSSRPFEPRKPYSFLVDVKSTKVVVKVKGKTLFSHKRKNAQYGFLTLFGLEGSSREGLVVRIRGELDPSWIARKIEGASAQLLEDFADSYIVEEHLPAWLFEVSPNALTNTAEALGKPYRKYPGVELGAEAAEFFHRFNLEAGSFAKNIDAPLKEIELAQQENNLSAAAADCLRMQIFQAHGRLEEAAVVGERMVSEAPDHHRWVMHYVELQMLRGDYAKARPVLQAARLLWPLSSEIFEASVAVEVQNRLWGPAQALVTEARARRAFDGEEGMILQSNLNKAIWGPAWKEPFVFESEHFLVKSEVSQQRCEEVANLLESTYSAYEAPLKPLPDLGANKLRVFLFANKAKYDQYLDGNLRLDVTNFNGIYHSWLRQLLVWEGDQSNSANSTIVHEGFHQYMDMVSVDPSFWFDEGMAGALTASGVVDGYWTTLAKYPNYIHTLLGGNLVPLAKFVSMSNLEFRGEGVNFHLMQGWAFLQFLRDSGPEGRAMLGALSKGYLSSASSKQVFSDVFGFVNMEELDQRFLEYLQAQI